jgi:soluble lytic murein transglycosylase
VDWVERIPFTETRNYVQRVMENLQVYRGLLEQHSSLLIESDLKRGLRQ